MEKLEKINGTFCSDFINLQGEIQTLPKDKSGYGYKYTDLDTIISYLRPLLKKYNFGFMQNLKTIINESGKITGIETIIIHANGETVNSFVEIPEIQVGKANNAQNIGAAISYFKRYALAAAFGISSDEDIDCSSLALENHSQASETTAPTVKNTYSKKTSTTQDKNLTKNKPAPKYTKEQGAELGRVVNTLFKDGSPVFTEEEKATYRNMLLKGEYENAIIQARDLLDKREIERAGDMY